MSALLAALFGQNETCHEIGLGWRLHSAASCQLTCSQQKNCTSADMGCVGILIS